jgi:phospholipid-binding lipoprotein MlaA
MTGYTRPDTTRPYRHHALALLIGCLGALLCTPSQAADTPNDPWERLNRATYAFNSAFDRMLGRPVAKAYVAVLPEAGRHAISNFVANLAYPTAIVNDALQGKIVIAGSDTARFVVNSSIGLAGLFDPATHLGLASHHQDFGQTLGTWGVPAGPYLMLPILGPSDLRDAPAELVDRYLTVDHYFDKSTERYGVTALRVVDRRAELLSTDATIDTAFDSYALIRASYLARRNYLVHDGQVPDVTYDDPPPDDNTDTKTDTPK